MNQNVTIDVIIPVYNGASYIQEAIRSVAGQTYPPHTIIVVNDGSTDGTAEMVDAFALSCAIPLRHISKENGGLSSARNAGIKASTSEFVAFLDADDVWESNKLAQQVALFASTSESDLGVVYGRYSLIDDQGVEIIEPYYNPETCLRGRIFSDLLGANKICGSGSAVLVRRACFDRVGYFDETLRAAEDWDMWLRLAEQYSFDYVNESIVRIRRHHASMQKNQKSFFLNQLAFYRKWVFRLGEHDPAGDEWALFLNNCILRSIRYAYIEPMFFREVFRFSPEMKKKIFWRSRGSFVLSFCMRVTTIIVNKWNKR